MEEINNLQTSSIVKKAKDCGLDPSILYESVIELTKEGLLTASCINTAAGILLSDLELPQYFFKWISKDSLKKVLKVIATNLQVKDNTYVLRSEVSEVQLSMEEGVQVRIATAENRERMENVLSPVMSGHRIEYYYSKTHNYYTYIIKPERCKDIKEIKPGESRFSFNTVISGLPTPKTTKQRYEKFLKMSEDSVIPIISVSKSESTNETRIMFKEDFSKSILPIIRRMLEEIDVTLNRAYWETYRGKTNRIESICSLYLDGTLSKEKLQSVIKRLHFIVAIQPTDIDEIYIHGQISFYQYIFATIAAGFVHTFIYKNQITDTRIMENLESKQLKDGFAKRIFESNKAEYSRSIINSAIKQKPELINEIFSVFDKKFNPSYKNRNLKTIDSDIENYKKHVQIEFAEDKTSADVFLFMTKLITSTLKTNFYKVKKRSFTFRFSGDILDPLVFEQKVHSIFFVMGLYAIGSHMRAAEIARGGLRLIRVTKTNYETELDYMPLLNYALGPVAQRLKHKDIAESGAKGVIVPYPEYPADSLNAVLDFADGILDLVLTSKEIISFYRKPEMIFFGPDEGTGHFMDIISEHAKKRGYKYWRTITTGKSTGIPHDAYGLTTEKKVFGLFPEKTGTRFYLDGKKTVITKNMEEIYREIGNNIYSSGMTTTGVMACLRTVLKHLGMKEENTSLMMSGGPDGDLGANQIQSYKGKIKLIIDSGSVLFDPCGLDKKELMKIAFARYTSPRINSLAYPEKKISKQGFRIARIKQAFILPDNTKVEDGSYFHKNFFSDVSLRKFIREANIDVFVPCGGLKDTINADNVAQFLELFKELKIIIEGANVFFDDTARDFIAGKGILQIRDSSANKGGVISSSIAEVLPGFLLGNRYEQILVENQKQRISLVKSVFGIIETNAIRETEMLLSLNKKTEKHLHNLSMETSEMLFSLQEQLYGILGLLKKRKNIILRILYSYVPDVLIKIIGIEKIFKILNNPDLKSYLDAIITKKIAQTALYRHADDWENFNTKIKQKPIEMIESLFIA